MHQTRLGRTKIFQKCQVTRQDLLLLVCFLLLMCDTLILSIFFLSAVAEWTRPALHSRLRRRNEGFP